MAFGDIDPASFQAADPFRKAFEFGIQMPGQIAQMQNAPQMAKQALLQAIAQTKLTQAQAQHQQTLANNPFAGTDFGALFQLAQTYPQVAQQLGLGSPNAQNGPMQAPESAAGAAATGPQVQGAPTGWGTTPSPEAQGAETMPAALPITNANRQANQQAFGADAQQTINPQPIVAGQQPAPQPAPQPAGQIPSLVQNYLHSKLNQMAYGSQMSPDEQAARQAQLAAASEKAKLAQQSWNTYQTDLGDDAKNAQTEQNQLAGAVDAYDKSYFKGTEKGNVPVRGVKGALLELLSQRDLSNEQMADTMFSNVAASMAKSLVGGKVSNYEFQSTQNLLKPGRNQDPAAVHTLTQSMAAINQRKLQEQQFATYMQNKADSDPSITPSVTKSLWQEYLNQRPAFDFKTRKINSQWLGQNGWAPYTSPEAINAVRNGQPFIPKGGVSKDSMALAGRNAQDLLANNQMPSVSAIPKFNTREEFLAWKKSLSPQQLAVYKQQHGAG